MFKIRCFPDKNYKAIWHDGKTIRIALDPAKPILELDYPEFWDVSVTNQCNGDCPYCYQFSTPTFKHYANIVGKIKYFFGRMDENQRPFQIAYGGGEPTLHPDFIDLIHATDDLGIVPNYTTNGMSLTMGQSKELLRVTVTHCGAVAVTTHEHLRDYWSPAIQMLAGEGITTNLHILIHDKKSVDNFLRIYEKWQGYIRYFVLLPLLNKGRAAGYQVANDYLFEQLKKLQERGEKLDWIAFGANFYEELKKRDLKLSLYEPEIMSKYLVLNDEMEIFKSSFN